jgi:hypothetical protein
VCEAHVGFVRCYTAAGLGLGIDWDLRKSVE